MGQKGDHRRVLRTKTLNVLTTERSYQLSIQIEHLHAKVPLLKLNWKNQDFREDMPEKDSARHCMTVARTFF
jgi:hypothetical protein